MTLTLNNTVLLCSDPQNVLENDKNLDTATWLKYDISKLDRSIVVSLLKCSVCIWFEEKLRGQRNFKLAFIVGSTNLRASSFKDHVSDTHVQCYSINKPYLVVLLTTHLLLRALSTLDANTQTIVSKV